MGPEEACWIWKPAAGAGGYGQFTSKGKTYLAHRLSYTLAKGRIPEGLTIDHLCRVRNCVNPTHLEAVTLAENLRRARAWAHGAAFQRSKSHCPAGHPYDEANTYVQAKGSRTCRACTRDRMRRKRAAIPPKPRKRKTHCSKGHAYAEYGYTNDIGRQICRTCSAERLRESRARRKALEPPKEPARTCKHGHEWTEANTYIRPSTGQRFCRACHNENTLARYHARKNAAS
jgi:hypothetical protein